jgi:hypothetical protein
MTRKVIMMMLFLFSNMMIMTMTVQGFVTPSSSTRRSRSSSSSTSFLHYSLNRETGKSQLDPTVYERYTSLPFPPDLVLAEYVWVDAVGNLRSKTRTLPVAKVRNSFDHAVIDESTSTSTSTSF